MTISKVDLLVALTFVLLNIGVFCAAFCRLVPMDEQNTKPTVRHLYVLVVVAGVTGAMATLMWGFVPKWPALLSPASLLGVLAVSSRRWSAGVPQEYRR